MADSTSNLTTDLAPNLVTDSAPQPENPQNVAEIYETLKEQFDGTPYPWVPIDTPASDYREIFYPHSVVSAFYACDRRVVSTQGCTILDVGCGSGFKTQVLAAVNPGAKIIGFDLSPRSIALAQERMAVHGYADRVECRVGSLENLAEWGETFDYINCDEILYLLPDTLAGLQALAAVLKPDGLMRANWHNAFQRSHVYRAQRALEITGLRKPGGDRASLNDVEALLDELSDQVEIARSWRKYHRDSREDRDEVLMSNFLIQGDHGFTIPDVFDLMAQSGLTLARFLRPSDWAWDDLFRQARSERPEFIHELESRLSDRDRLHIYELLKPDNRLIDLWCRPVGDRPPLPPSPETWSDDQWTRAQVALHPALTTPEFQEALESAVRSLKPLNLTRFFPLPRGIAAASSLKLPALLPLVVGPQPLPVLVERVRQARPIDPISREPIDLEALTRSVRTFLVDLADVGYLTIELA